VPPSAMEAIKAVEKDPSPKEINALTKELNGLSEKQMFALSNQVNDQWMKQNSADPHLPNISLTPEGAEAYQYDHDHPVQPRYGQADGAAASSGGSGGGPNSVDDTHFR